MIKVIVEPELEPVTLDDVYVALRLDTDGDSPPTHPHDGMLQRNITTSRQQCEQITRRAFCQQTLRITSQEFPYCRVRFGGDYDYEVRNGYIELKRPPLIEVVSVTYYDQNNSLQTIAAENYFIDESSIVPRLQFTDQFQFPAVYRRDDALQVTYKAGYEPEGSPPDDFVSNVPQGIKDAILIGVQLLYDPLSPDQRTAYQNAQESLLYSYKVHNL
jgi:uncharacterized phiE125 gp8 family phage protein